MSQVVEFFAAPGQTVTAQLYSAGSDTLVSSQSATEATNRKGVYTATYTGVAAGTYRVLALVGSTPIATWWVDLLTGSATYIAYEMPLAVQVASIFNASPSAGWTNGSFGDRFLVSATAQRTVSVTGSNHVASVVHSMEPNVMTASALASDAVSEIATAVAATQALSRLDSMIESDGAGQFRFDTIALSMIPTGNAGTGARTVTITVNYSGSPVESAVVRLSRAGESYSVVTNVSGQAVFNVNDGTWTVSITASNLAFAGASLVVDGTENIAYNMTAAGGGVSPSTPPYTTGYWTVLDLNGATQSGAQVTIQVANPPKDSTGLVLEDAARTGTANGSGVVQFSNLIKGATYTVYRTGSSRKFNVTVPANAGNTVALGSIVG